MTDAAPAVIQLPRWKWLPGMRAFHIGGAVRVLSVEEDDFLGEDYFVLFVFVERLREFATIVAQNETFPDLQDPATGGCLLELLGEEARRIERIGDRWFVFFDASSEDFQHLGEACARRALFRGTF